MEISPAFEEFARRYTEAKPVLVWIDLVADLETPVSAMLKLANGKPMSFLFESVEGGERIGRYSIIGMKPDLIWRCFRNEAEINRGALANPSAFQKDPKGALDSLRALIAECRVESDAPLPPMAAGLFGYLGYSTVGLVERLPDAKPDTLGIPDGMLVRPTIICIFDNVLDSVTVVTPVWPSPTSARAAYEHACERLAEVLADFERDLPQRHAADETVEPLPPPEANMTREQCLAMVETAKEYIRAGELFQV